MKKAQAEMEQREAVREQKKAIIQQILTNEARERLANIAVVKPEKAEKLEMILIQNAQRGVFQGKVSEKQMIDLLEQVNEREQKEQMTVQFKRKRFDDDDLDDLGI
ncbi:programmed cell death protein 5-like [Stylonychia lemnae]|uniref:Programmed cell death protein 5-like n=1 Tax=Stylonychia lemnae TaxID=5949 RepID=A0A078AQI6_STYLE|nr:programmed cell death protein 5-like [Stylonychia lemnae]|eukprot:CDW83183.1 programmed cell death protein 5-like [Stylonychia lemnae]